MKTMPILVLLARVGARTDSTTCTQPRVWPISVHTQWLFLQYAPRVLHFSAFHIIMYNNVFEYFVH